MSVLFGGNLAEELAKSVRHLNEDFDSIDEDSFYERNQCKRRTTDYVPSSIQRIPQRTRIEEEEQINPKNDPPEGDLGAFIEDEDEDGPDPGSNENHDTDSNDTPEEARNSDDEGEPDLTTNPFEGEPDNSDGDKEESPSKPQLFEEAPKHYTSLNRSTLATEPTRAIGLDGVEYIDVRPQTIFKYSRRLQFKNLHKSLNYLKDSYARIHNNNVRLTYKRKLGDADSRREERIKKKRNAVAGGQNPFLNEITIRQHFRIERHRHDWSNIHDSDRVRKLARNNQVEWCFISYALRTNKFSEFTLRIHFGICRFSLIFTLFEY